MATHWYKALQSKILFSPITLIKHNMIGFIQLVIFLRNGKTFMFFLRHFLHQQAA